MMQDSPEDKENNRVPFPKRQVLSTLDFISRGREVIELMVNIDKKNRDIERVSKGDRNGKHEFYISHDLNLIDL